MTRVGSGYRFNRLWGECIVTVDTIARVANVRIEAEYHLAWHIVVTCLRTGRMVWRSIPFSRAEAAARVGTMLARGEQYGEWYCCGQGAAAVGCEFGECSLPATYRVDATGDVFCDCHAHLMVL